MQGKHLLEVACPGKPLAIAIELNACQVIERSSRCVFAGNPLGIDKGHLALYGSHRDLKLRMKNLLGRMGGIHDDLNGPRRCGSSRWSRFSLAKTCNRNYSQSAQHRALKQSPHGGFLSGRIIQIKEWRRWGARAFQNV